MIEPPGNPSASDRRRARWIALLVFVIGSLLIYDANDGNTDAEVHFQQVRAMAKYGTFAFVPDHGVPRSIIAWESTPGAAGAASQKGVDGRVYGHFGVYYVLCGVPFYYLGEWIGALFPGIEAAVKEKPFLLNGVGTMQDYFPRLCLTLISPLFLALAAASIYRTSRSLGAGTAAATLASLGYCYSTFAGVQARHCGSDTMAAGLLAFTLERALACRGGGRTAPLGAGIAAGLLFGARYLAIAVLPGALLAMAVGIARSGVGRRPMAAAYLLFAIPFATLVAVVLLCNVSRWGSPFDFGYRHSFETDHEIAFDALTAGPRGLLLSFFAPSRGLFIFAFPAVVLGAAGVVLLWRRDRWMTLAVVVGILSTAIPPSLSIVWHGTWSYGPRYHLPCVLFFIPAAALALSAAWHRTATRWMAMMAFAAGTAVVLPALVTSPIGFLTAASEALRIERPAASYPEPYRSNESLVEADRQELLPIAPPGSPYNAVSGQWRFLYFALRGAQEVPLRAMFGLDSDATFRPLLTEHRPGASPWWLTLRARLSRP